MPDHHLAGPPVPISTTAPQPPPLITETGRCIQDLVEAEMRAMGASGAAVADDVVKRKAQGLAKYGTVLRPFNGRDATVDLYQELLDAAQYARQILAEELIAGAAGPVTGIYPLLLMMAIRVREMIADQELDGEIGR